MSKQRKYNVGDLVYVVPQRNRRHHGDHAGNLMPISKVGRKWCYIERWYGVPGVFDPKTGESVHKEGNVRSNGYGFDVYESEAAYMQAEQDRSDNRKLNEKLRRLTNGVSILLPPHAVKAILAILGQCESEES